MELKSHFRRNTMRKLIAVAAAGLLVASPFAFADEQNQQGWSDKTDVIQTLPSKNTDKVIIETDKAQQLSEQDQPAEPKEMMKPKNHHYKGKDKKHHI